ncbi:sulfurtransferase complex subunit TusC [Conservatibacter flavescens]|uniref:sulfurtransferase complex subunit TusC n=1 Tax=Conservatibacter flavescens TaxID=28161 RepID=UPI001A9C546C|nr:sulfurtransferase complex subunit TusC [Conservatibacter flavescens]
MQIAFVFRTAPYGTSVSREGLDALLAASAFCEPEEMAVFFIDDGIFNLCSIQQPESILQKNIGAMFKLLDLYDIEQRYICQQSLSNFNMDAMPLLINCEKIDRTLMMSKLKSAAKILTF